MSIEISSKNEARLKATAQADGVSLDTCVETLLNEREEFAVIVERASARLRRLSHEQTHTSIERGFLQSENGEVFDGEASSAKLDAELDGMEHQRLAG
jgi:hypothetical protein